MRWRAHCVPHVRAQGDTERKAAGKTAHVPHRPRPRRRRRCAVCAASASGRRGAYLSPWPQAYNNHEEIVKYFDGGYKTVIGYGLHYGWAIEGAVGTNIKIDCSYLSPNVNLAARLESATKMYGVNVLMSESFVSKLSPEVHSPPFDVYQSSLCHPKRALAIPSRRPTDAQWSAPRRRRLPKGLVHPDGHLHVRPLKRYYVLEDGSRPLRRRQGATSPPPSLPRALPAAPVL